MRALVRRWVLWTSHEILQVLLASGHGKPLRCARLELGWPDGAECSRCLCWACWAEVLDARTHRAVSPPVHVKRVARWQPADVVDHAEEVSLAITGSRG